jgi:hypothetical protein
MSFMDELRARIGNAPLGSKDRILLKVILGELQNLPGSGKSKDPEPSLERCVGHVKSIIKTNKETIERIQGKRGMDNKVLELEDENMLLSSLLPQPQLTESEIREHLSGIDLTSPSQDGAAIGMAMGHFKKNNLFLNVDRDVVVKIVKEIRWA